MMLNSQMPDIDAIFEALNAKSDHLLLKEAICKYLFSQGKSDEIVTDNMIDGTIRLLMSRIIKKINYCAEQKKTLRGVNNLFKNIV